MMKTAGQRLPIILPILLVSIGLDRWTKICATEELYGEPIRSYFNDMFRLLYVENTGAFLSLGSSLPEGLRQWLLTLLPALLLLGLLGYTLFHKELLRPHVIAFSFILAGGLSNIYDRILEGSVVDFMNMGIGSLRTGIFNVADMSIMLGLFIMLPFLFAKPKKEGSQSAAPADEA